MSAFLIIDHDDSLRADICNFFRSIGHSVYEAREYREARDLLAAHDCDVVIASATVTGGAIRDLIPTAKERNPETVVLVYADLQTTQEGILAVRAGAFTLVQKPFSIPELNFQIKRALGRKGALVPHPSPAVAASTTREPYQPYNFIGESKEIRRVFSIVERVAATDCSVIIVGETGTGKELVAGAIHYNSPRAGSPFVRVNCAALPEQLLESELFGYEKGAFTGADRARVGRFEHANGGTIFLDEIADMSLFTQAKVLRVIQEKEFERLGSNDTVKTDVRIISATNRDLMDRMSRGLFREDLFYRLNVVTVRLPPLRERGGDIDLLIQFFMQKISLEMKKGIRGIEPDAMRTLKGHSWPGNIRELENAIERAILLAEGETISVGDLDLFASPEDRRGGEEAVRLPPGGIHLQDAERAFITQALERCGWVQKKAAALLGLSSRVLNYRIKQFGITHPSWRQHR